MKTFLGGAMVLTPNGLLPTKVCRACGALFTFIKRAEWEERDVTFCRACCQRTPQACRSPVSKDGACRVCGVIDIEGPRP